jgi:hypothetical protein
MPATAVWAIAGTDKVSPKINIKLCAIRRPTRIETAAAAIACAQRTFACAQRTLRRNEIKISPKSCRRLSLFGPIRDAI